MKSKQPSFVVGWNDVISWQRPKTTRTGQMYDPGNKDLKRMRAEAAEQLGRQGVSEPDADSRWRLSVSVICADKRRRDVDRVASMCMDALEGVAYENDSQVDQLEVERLWSDDGTHATVAALDRIG